MKNLPKELLAGTKWLLDFANLGRKPGLLDPPTGEYAKKIKRKPTVKDIGFSESFKYVPSPSDNKSQWFIYKDHKFFFEKKKLIWMDSQGGFSFVFEDFIKMLEKKGLPPYRWEDIQDIRLNEGFGKVLLQRNATFRRVMIDYKLWVRRVLLTVITKPSDASEFESWLSDSICLTRPKLYKDKNEFKIFITHEGKYLKSAITAYIVNLWLNKKEFHSLFKMCPACGRFFKEGGRIFCTPKCRGGFHEKSKKDDRERKKIEREYERKQEFNRVFKFIVSEFDSSEDEAKEEAKEWIRKGKNLKQYKKEYCEQ